MGTRSISFLRYYIYHTSAVYSLMSRMSTALIITIIATIETSMVPAVAEQPSQQPSAKERLNQVLDTEGGMQVYKDHKGNVESTIVLPNGERIITVQPLQSPGLNLGPPLQSNNQTLTFPPPSQPPAAPPAPEFPQKAR